MELIIVKNSHILARATDNDSTTADTYELRQVETVPEYPTERPPKGKEWHLDYVDGELEWILADRPLTIEERLEQVEEKQNAWKPGEQVYSAQDAPDGIADRRYYGEWWYTCIQSHVTQADWTPDITPALWKREG